MYTEAAELMTRIVSQQSQIAKAPTINRIEIPEDKYRRRARRYEYRWRQSLRRHLAYAHNSSGRNNGLKQNEN